MFKRLMGVQRREVSIEDTCRQLAEDRGFMLKKLTHKVGDPDRLLVMSKGHVVFIEFKRPGEEPTRIQRHRARELQKLDHRTYVVDSVGAFVNLMFTLEAEWKLGEPREVKHYESFDYPGY